MPFDSSEVTVGELARVFERLLERAVPDDIEPTTRPQRSLSEMMTVVLRALPKKYASLDEIVVGEFTRIEIIWWFLALLELIRVGQARVTVNGGNVRFRREVSG